MDRISRAIGGLAVALSLLAAIPASAEPYHLLSIDGTQVRWLLGQGQRHVELRYALATGNVETASARNCQHIRPVASLLQNSGISEQEFTRAVADAFARWQRVVNIKFVEVSDAASADIVIGEQVDLTGHAYTNVVLDHAAGLAVTSISSAQICLNPDKVWKIGFNGNLAVYDLVHTISHEIGHAIGLDHPDERGHLMSFRYHETRADLSAGDVAGATALYGSRAARPSAAVTTGAVPERRSE